MSNEPHNFLEDDDVYGMPGKPRVKPGFLILIIDDNQDSAQSLATLFKVMGHEARAVYNGPDALALAPEYVPDFVFLDLGIPGMSGYEILHMMKDMPELSHTVFVAQTGWSDKEFINRSREAGFDHHLIKPLDVQVLEKIIKNKANL